MGERIFKIHPKLLALAGAGVLAITTLSGCTPQDEEGLRKEAAIAAATAAARPTSEPHPYVKKVKEELQVGKSVDIWEGTWRLDSSVARREYNGAFADRLCADYSPSQNCRVDGKFPGLGRNEQVENPLREEGSATVDDASRSGYSRVTKTISVNGLGYLDSQTDQPVWVALIPTENGDYIHRNGVSFNNLRPITVKDAQQTVTITAIEKDQEGKTLVKAQKQDGQVVNVGRSRLSKVLGF